MIRIGERSSPLILRILCGLESALSNVKPAPLDRITWDMQCSVDIGLNDIRLVLVSNMSLPSQEEVEKLKQELSELKYMAALTDPTLPDEISKLRKMMVAVSACCTSRKRVD